MSGLSRVPNSKVISVFGLCTLLLSACAPAPTEQAFNDPYEAQNRERHAFNKRIDPGKGSGGGAYKAVPAPARTGVSNFANNIRLPSMAIQNLLQFDVEGLAQNSFRFAINSTFGIAGLFDPATAIGLNEDLTGFGQTLDVWGVGQGAYLELPVLGPSTERDAVGGVVDLVTNPYFYVTGTGGTVVGLLALIGDRLNDRVRYANTIESVLYDSEDSYAQSRLIYLQNREFELRRDTEEETYFDPYSDSEDNITSENPAAAVAGADFTDPYFDPYSDPYADPYDP